MKLENPAFSVFLYFSIYSAILLPAACIIAPPPPSYIESPSVGEENRPPRKYHSRGDGECDRDRRCEETCDKIFTVPSKRDICEDLSINEVKRLEEVFLVLENPNREDLEAMDLKALEDLLDIGLNPLRSTVGKMSRVEREKFLAWLAGDPAAVEIIETKETDFEIMKELFGNSPAVIVKDLNRGIEGGNTFTKITLRVENEPALDWLHDFFGHVCGKRSDYRRCLFEDFYCKLSLSRSSEDEYFNYEFFEDMLNDILENERKTSGAPDWWPVGADSGDMESWKTSPHRVCSFLK